MADLDAVEARIWALLAPYRDELEDATIYGMPSLRWPGSGGHDYFAAVKRSGQKVSLYAIAVETWPEALDASSHGSTGHTERITLPPRRTSREHTWRPWR